MNKKELIQAIEEEHKKQRSWQRLVNDEVLDYEFLNSLTIEQLQEALKSIKK